MSAYIYILANKKNGTIYTGVTNDIVRRVFEHRQGFVERFSKKYDVKRLVYFDSFESIYDAITMEKRIKRWRREWKLALIEKLNPVWQHLYEQLTS
jgi:putative endonuclease